MRFHWLCLSLLLFILVVSGVGSAQYDVTLEGPDAGGGSGFPGSNITHTYVIRNTGTVTDTYNITADSENGWPLTYISEYNVNPGESAIANIEVTIPSDAQAYDTDDLNVIVQSPYASDNNNSVTVVFRVADLAVTGSASLSGDPGDRVYVDFTITNQGNYEDNYTIVASARDTEFRNWSVSYERTTTIIASGDDFIVGVAVDIPASTYKDIVAANTPGTVTLTATSMFNKDVSGSANTNVRVSEARGVDIHIQGPSQIEVEVGDSAEFKINVTNTANFESKDTYNLSAWAAQLGWITVVQPNEISLNNSESKLVQLTVTPPAQPRRRRCECYVDATSFKDPTKNDTLVVEAMVPQTYGVDVEAVQPVTKMGKPNEMVQFAFTVQNTGNDADVFTLVANSTYGWQLGYTGTLALDYDEEVTTFVNVTVKGATPIGTRDFINLTVIAGDGKSLDGAEVSLEVEQGYGVDVSPDSVSYDVGPGESIVIYFNVTNEGNGEDTFDLKVNTGLDYTMEPDIEETTLGPAQKQMLKFRFDIPEGALSGTIYTAFLNATSQKDPFANDQSNITLTAKSVRSVLVHPAVDATGDPDDYALLEFTIENTGNVDDSYNLEVRTNRVGWDPLIINDPGGGVTWAVGEKKLIQVTVFIPSGVDADSQAFITLTATSSGDKSVSGENAGVVIAALVTSVKLDTFVTNLKVIEGERGEIPIYVENTGNGFETINLSYSVSPSNWNIIPDLGPFLLERGQSETALLEIIAPGGSFGSTATITVTATIAEGPGMDTYDVYATSSFIMAPGGPFIYSFPRSTEVFQVMVKNLFAQSSQVLITQPSIGGWTTRVDQTEFILAQGESKVLEVTVTAPPTLFHLDTVPLDFTATMVNIGNSSETLDFSIVSLSPDISIFDMEMDSTAVEGETMDVRFTVRVDGAKTGDPDVDLLDDIPVEVFVDGELVFRNVIDIELDDERNFDVKVEIPHLKWYQRSEDHEVAVVIGADKYESSGSLNDNVETHDVSVQKNINPITFIALIAIIVVAFISIKNNSKKVRLKQKQYEHILKGLLVASILGAFVLIPLHSSVLDASGATIAILTVGFLIPIFAAVTGYRTKSYSAVAIICLLMFWLFYLSLSAGLPADEIAGSLFVPPSPLPPPTIVFLLLAFIIGMMAVYTIVRLLYNANSAYARAKDLVEAVKRGEF